ncbi:MAG: hypothetical protein P4L43_08405 [Syntrophobacteraceae bacterium]|nr:hypothetical protein [Syntrophobacteraceae bacterium]
MIMILSHFIKETDVRKINFLVFALLVMACAACVSPIPEVKPLLKPGVVPIAQRIADQKKWLDQDIAAKAITPAQAKPIRDKLEQIKKEYDRLQTEGSLTPKDAKALNRMVDKTSEQIFRMTTGPGHAH